MNTFLSFILKRLGVTLLVLFAATYFMYVLTAYSGDPLEDLRTSTARNKEELIARRVELLNLDVNPFLRYFIWLGGVLKLFIGQFDLGKNLNGQDVTDLVGAAISSTLQLVTTATFIAITIGITVGILTALRQYSRFDYSVTLLAFIFFSLPVFWVAILLKQYLAIGFNDFLQNPNIGWPALLAIGIVTGFFWAGIIQGNRKKLLTVFAIAFVGSIALIQTLVWINWFNNPGIGMFAGAVIGSGLALLITAISVGLENKRARNLALVQVAIGLAIWIPFNMVSLFVSPILLVLIFIAMTLIGWAIGYYFGGEDKHAVARTAALAGFAMTAVVSLDRFMQAWKPYSESSFINGRPFATVGSQTPNLVSSFWVQGVDSFTHLLLPTLALLLIGFAGYTRYARASMLEIMNQDFIRTARAKGLNERTVVMRHAFRNSLIPMTTLVAFDFAGIVGGAVITETVFGWSGMGSLFVESLKRVDLNPVMGFFLVTSIVAVVFNLIADIVYSLLDPRIRVS
jgi:peptide/nickel transport system permease protein